MRTTSSRVPAPEPFEVLWSPEQPDEIHLVTSDATFTDVGDERPVTSSKNPKSANWHPAYFNRCVRVLKKAKEPAPEEVQDHNRRLDKRGKHVAGWMKEHGQ